MQFSDRCPAPNLFNGTARLLSEQGRGDAIRRAALGGDAEKGFFIAPLPRPQNSGQFVNRLRLSLVFPNPCLSVNAQ
jgi:hypothetical protein